MSKKEQVRLYKNAEPHVTISDFAKIEKSLEVLPIGKAIAKRTGRSVAILAFGSMVAPALEAAEKLDATVIDMRFVKPLDEDLIGEMTTRHDLIVTLEENAAEQKLRNTRGEFLKARNASAKS